MLKPGSVRVQSLRSTPVGAEPTSTRTSCAPPSSLISRFGRIGKCACPLSRGRLIRHPGSGPGSGAHQGSNWFSWFFLKTCNKALKSNGLVQLTCRDWDFIILVSYEADYPSLPYIIGDTLKCFQLYIVTHNRTNAIESIHLR